MGDSRNVINARRHINIRDTAINCGLPIFHIAYMYLTTNVCTELTPLTRNRSAPELLSNTQGSSRLDQEKVSVEWNLFQDETRK